MIEKLQNLYLKNAIQSIYDCTGYSTQEILSCFESKINECIQLGNDTYKLAEWLVSVGLSEEIIKQLEKWLIDGTLKTIINEELFNQLNDNIKLNSKAIDNINISSYLVYPYTFRIYQSNADNGLVTFHWEGLLYNKNISVNYTELIEKFKKNIMLSYQGFDKSLFIRSSELFIFNTIDNIFEIIEIGKFEIGKHKLLLNNINGCATKGDLCMYTNYYRDWDKETSNNPISNEQKYDVANSLSIHSFNLSTNSVSFAFITDIHQQEFYSGYYSQGLNVINKMLSDSILDFCINGGDNILKGNRIEAMANHTILSNRMKGKFYYSKGNHDGNGSDNELQEYSDRVWNQDLYNIYCRKFKNDVEFGSKNNIYYYKDIDEKLRLIVLNTHDIPESSHNGIMDYNDNNIAAMRHDQLVWFSKILEESNGKHLLIVGHKAPLSENDGIIGNGNGWNYNSDIVRNIIKAYKNKTSYSWNTKNDDPTFDTNGSINCSNLLESSVICWLAGHTHYENYVSADNIAYVTRNCDYIRNWKDNQIERIEGKYTQYSFSMFSINKEERQVKVTNAGVGSSTYWNY